MELFYQVTQCNRKEIKRWALRVYLCWSVCVDTAALAALLWYIFK